VSIWPASPGTGIIASKTIRAILECVGVRDAVGKSMGSKNASSVAKAAVTALMKLQSREEIHGRRGLEAKGRRKGVVIKLSDPGADPGGVGWN
jgi:small subunit ribosomal protein S5